MSIACTLGLISCLNYTDTTVDFEDAMNIVETCEELTDSNYPAMSYMGGSHNGSAYFKAEHLWDLGLRFDWNPPNIPKERTAGSELRRMEFRRSAILSECTYFKNQFNSDQNWRNYEKRAADYENWLRN